MNDKSLSEYVKLMRKEHNLTQVELSEKSGVGLRFVRELEQRKQSLRLDNDLSFILYPLGYKSGCGFMDYTL